jgi:CRISPR-associated protein Csm4
MKTEIIKLSLKQKSALLTPLQSDTIFGSFCWRLKEQLGEEHLLTFLNLFRKDEPVFTVSEAFFESASDKEIYFPKPYFPIPESKQPVANWREKLLQKAQNKKSKQKAFITLNALNSFLNSDFEEYSSIISTQSDFPGIETHNR